MTNQLTDDLIAAQRLYIKLRAERDEAEASLKALQRRIDGLQASLVEQMCANGQTSTTLDGYRLVLRTTPRITRFHGVSSEELCEVLRPTEFSSLIKPNVNAQSLQAAMREVIEDSGGLPEELEPYLKIWEQTVIAVSKV